MLSSGEYFQPPKWKFFCIYFYQGNITFKNIINLVSFIINLVEYLVINSYSVTVLDNFRKEISDRAKKLLFLEEYSTASLSFWGIPSPSWTKVWWRYHFDSLNYHFFFFYHISTGKRALQLLGALDYPYVDKTLFIAESSHVYISIIDRPFCLVIITWNTIINLNSCSSSMQGLVLKPSTYPIHESSWCKVDTKHSLKLKLTHWLVVWSQQISFGYQSVKLVYTVYIKCYITL